MVRLLVFPAQVTQYACSIPVRIMECKGFQGGITNIFLYNICSICVKDNVTCEAYAVERWWNGWKPMRHHIWFVLNAGVRVIEWLLIRYRRRSRMSQFELALQY